LAYIFAAESIGVS